MVGALSLSRFRARLLITILAMSLIPLLLTGWTFIYFLGRHNTSETFQKLDVLRDGKRDELQQYLTFALWKAENLSASSSLRYAAGLYYGFSYGFRLIDPSPEAAARTLRQIFDVENPARSETGIRHALLQRAPEYGNAYDRFDAEFRKFIDSSEFSNLYLLDANQRVVYSVTADRYLGLDLRDEQSTSPLAEAARSALANREQQTYISDFRKDPVTGEFSALVATRIEFYRRARGVAVFRLPAEKLNRIVQSVSPSTGQIYLLNETQHLISLPPTSPLSLGAQVKAAALATDGRGLLRAGLGGEPALAAFDTISVRNLHWPLIAEIPNEVAFASNTLIKNLLAILSVMVLPLIICAAIFLSKSMTQPLRKLTEAAGAIADGELDREVPIARSPYEVYRLSVSFRRMRDSLREQLNLVGEKNRQLETQIAVIEEKNAALENADRAKDAFIANTSHELRTPLTAIIGIAETLTAGMNGSVSQVQRSQLQMIVYSARRLSRLVDDLLDLYCIRENRIRLDLQPVDLQASIHNLLRLVEPLSRDSAITFSLSLDDIPFVHADPLRMEQILYNLIVNAIKFTGAGTITIDARAVDGMVEISVIDSGRGIAAQDMERIFHPFERGSDYPLTEQPAGTGLGLAIARHLASLMGGKLSARSQIGVGSNFTLSLPKSSEVVAGDFTPRLTLGHDILPQPIDIDLSPPEALGDDVPLILVVDDEPVNVRVLQGILRQQGYAVQAAASGLEALEAIARRKPDLIVLDVMMPGMSGLEVSRKLRERYNVLELPIVMVTARSHIRDVLAGFDSGANDYVTKPFIKDELVARVAILLEAGRSLVRARELADLRSEVERRIRVEDTLRLSVQRMERMLEVVDGAIFCLDSRKRVIYANQLAGEYLQGIQEDAIAALFHADVSAEVERQIELKGSAMLPDLRLSAERRVITLHALEMDAVAGGGIVVILVGSDLRQSVRLLDDFRQSLRANNGADILVEEAAGRSPKSSDVDSDRHYREALVAVMALSLSIWRQATSKSKIDLAEQSGIWRVNLDRSSLQVRTFDKYLLLETLPQNPRWRDVVMTGEFVLAFIQKQSFVEVPHDETNDLRECLSRLRTIVRKRTSSAE